MSDGGAPKRRASRARTTPGLGHLNPQFCLAEWTTENGLPPWPSVEDARERIDEALLRYSRSIDLRDAAINEREKARLRIRGATERLIEALAAPGAADLLNGMHAFPAGVQLNSVLLGRPRPDNRDLGHVPGDNERVLKRFLTALDARIWEDQGGGDADNDAAPGDDGPAAFAGLIGALNSIFDAAFLRPRSGAWERLARAMLEAAEVRPINGAPFSKTAIRDALQDFRRAGGSG
jgi:hypothetical protein